jgi:hypothetical protein
MLSSVFGDNIDKKKTRKFKSILKITVLCSRQEKYTERSHWGRKVILGLFHEILAIYWKLTRQFTINQSCYFEILVTVIFW